MAKTFGRLDQVAEGFAAAALDPSRWDTAMDVAAKATGSFGAILLPVRGRSPLVPTGESMKSTMDDYFRDGWAQRDERYRSLPTFMRRGVACEFDFMTPEEISRSPFYQEYLTPHGLRWFGGVRVGECDDVWCLSIQRSIEQGPFAPTELKRLAALSRRLSGAAELARAFGFARMEAAVQAFEASGSAVAMIDRCGEVLRLNHAAERLLGPNLQIIRRRIISSDRDATAALDRALHALIWSREAEAFHTPIVLPRRQGRPIIAYPSRLSRSAAEGLALCHGFVVFVDLEARLTAAPGDLARVFGLTPAEARLATRLLSEDPIELAADKLGIAYETARNLLKSIFQKTDTHRQGQLVSLLSRMAQRQRDA
jgi:DNA-binding CsgD family transcriptional regulator